MSAFLGLFLDWANSTWRKKYKRVALKNPSYRVPDSHGAGVGQALGQSPSEQANLLPGAAGSSRKGASQVEQVALGCAGYVVYKGRCDSRCLRHCNKRLALTFE